MKYALDRREGPYYRIKALRDFDDVHAGDLGGLVSDDKCLSQDGDCWIYDDAIVSNSSISDNVKIRHKARVLDSTVKDNVVICHEAVVHTNSFLSGNVIVKNNVIICNSTIMGEYVINEWQEVHSASFCGSLNFLDVLEELDIKIPKNLSFKNTRYTKRINDMAQVYIVSKKIGFYTTVEFKNILKSHEVEARDFIFNVLYPAVRIYARSHFKLHLNDITVDKVDKNHLIIYFTI